MCTHEMLVEFLLHRNTELALSNGAFCYVRSEVSPLLRKGKCLVLCSKGPHSPEKLGFISI